MTVQSIGLTKTYACNGVTREFPWPWPLVYDDGIAVVQVLPDGGEADWIEGTDYSVRIQPDWMTATVVAVAAPAVGTSLRLLRVPLMEQRFSLPSYGELPAKTIERALDAFALDLQALGAMIGESLRLPPGAGPDDCYDAGDHWICNLRAPVRDDQAVNRGFIEPCIKELLPPFEEFSPQRWDFAADGATATFALPGVLAATPELFFVHVSGVMQTPHADYVIDVDAETITFAAPPPALEQPGKRNVQVRQMARTFAVSGGTIVTAAGGNTARSLADHLGTDIHVIDYGAPEDLVSPGAGAAINAAITEAVARGGGRVYLGRQHLIDEPIVLKSKVYLVPHGEGGTMLKARDVLNASMILYDGYPWLAPATGIAQAAGPASITLAASDSPVSGSLDGSSIEITAGTGFGQTRLIVAYNGTTRVATLDAPWTTQPAAGSAYRRFDNPHGLSHCGILDGLTLDGNRANNTSGSGLDLYGRNFTLEGVRIINCADEGLRSAWAIARRGDQDITGDPMVGAVVRDLVVLNCGGHGIYWNGPYASHFTGGMVGNNSLLNPGTASGAWIDTGGAGFRWFGGFAWGDSQRHGFVVGTATRVQLYCRIEDAALSAVLVSGNEFFFRGMIQQLTVATPPSPADFGMAGIELLNVHSPDVDAVISNCPRGAVVVTGGSGPGKIRVQGTMAAPLVPGSWGGAGLLPPTWDWQLNISGAQTRPSVYWAPAAYNMPAVYGAAEGSVGMVFDADGIRAVAHGRNLWKAGPWSTWQYAAEIGGRVPHRQRLPVVARTVDAQVLDLSAGGVIAYLEDNSEAYVFGNVVATAEGGGGASWTFKAQAFRAGGAGSVGVSGVNVISEVNSGDMGSVTVVADAGVGGVKLVATGQAGKAIRWLGDFNMMMLQRS